MGHLGIAVLGEFGEVREEPPIQLGGAREVFDQPGVVGQPAPDVEQDGAVGGQGPLQIGQEWPQPGAFALRPLTGACVPLAVAVAGAPVAEARW